MKERFLRRSILTVAGGASIGLAGCLGNGEPSESKNNVDTNDDNVDGDGADSDEEASTGEEDPPDWEVEGAPLDASFDVTIAVENLEKPWDLAFAPNGEVFLTERPGQTSKADRVRVP